MQARAMYQLGQVARGVSYLRLLRPMETETVPFELLPQGAWLKGEARENERPAPAVYRLTPVELPDRFSFLEGFSPSKVVMSDRSFGVLRGYRAYVVGSFVLVETTRHGNALYIFRASSDSWLSLIQLTKLDLLTGPYPDFVCRIIHQGDWQTRLKEILEA